jgi:hypothetical protein
MENSNPDIGFRLYIVHYLAILFLIFLIWIAYIMIVYPFWNLQPVFHSYDFWRYWSSVPFIIQLKKGQKPSKFCDFENVLTANYLEMPTERKLEVVDFLQCHYISDESALFLFHLENFDAYHVGHLFPSVCSFFYGKKNVLIEENQVLDIKLHMRMDAFISSRSIQFQFNGFGGSANSNTIVTMDLYYMDFVCLRRDFDVGILRKLMATHCWRCLGMDGVGVGGGDDSIRGAIFRKEGDAFAGVFAFLSFQSFFYDIRGGFERPLLPVHFILVSIHAKNAGLLTDFLKGFDSAAGVLCMSSVGNLMELVRKRILFIYMICRADEAFCLYIFRDTRTQYEKGGDAGALLQFVGSLHKSNSRELFYRGFVNALYDILSSGFGKNFRYFMVDDVGDNSIIVSDLREPFDHVDVNYYAYNLVVPRVKNALFIV